MSSLFAGPARGGGEALAAASPPWGATVPRAGAGSSGRGDLLLLPAPLLGLYSLLRRGPWGCAAIAHRGELASLSPGRHRSSFLSERAPSRVTVRGKLRPVPPSSPSPTAQAGADPPWASLRPPAPRLAAFGGGCCGGR